MICNRPEDKVGAFMSDDTTAFTEDVLKWHAKQQIELRFFTSVDQLRAELNKHLTSIALSFLDFSEGLAKTAIESDIRSVEAFLTENLEIPQANFEGQIEIVTGLKIDKVITVVLPSLLALEDGERTTMTATVSVSLSVKIIPASYPMSPPLKGWAEPQRSPAYFVML